MRNFSWFYHTVFLAEEEKEQRLNATREDAVELLPNTKKHKKLKEESDSDASVVVLDTTI